MRLNIFNRASKEAPEAKHTQSSPMIAFHGSGRAAWSGRDTNSLIRTGFMGNPIGFRCVKLISEASAAVPFTLLAGGHIQDTHPVLNLLANPNLHQSRAEFFESFYGQYLLSGDAYLEAVSSELDSVLGELYILRSDRMKVLPGRDGWPAAYEYMVGTKKHRYDLSSDCNPILHVRSFHPQDDHYGLSPMAAAATAIDVHNAASKWSKSLLDNAARPSGAIVYRGEDGQGNLANEQYSRLVDEIELNHQGAQNAGRPMLLEGGLDWKPMGFSPSDMEFLKTKENAAREIASAFGVPPMLLGLSGDNTYANYQEANRAFYRLTVLPLIGKVNASLSEWFSQHYGESITIEVDADKIPALAQERDMHWRRVSDAAFLSDEEKRKLLGLPQLSASKTE